MAVKLSMASGAAPSKPTLSSASATARRKPLFATSSVVVVAEEHDEAPIFPTDNITCGDWTRCRFASELSWSVAVGRFLDSIDIVVYSSSTAADNILRPKCRFPEMAGRRGRCAEVMIEWGRCECGYDALFGKELVLRSTAVHGPLFEAHMFSLHSRPQVPTVPFSSFPRISNSLIKCVNNSSRLHLIFGLGCIRGLCPILQ